MTSAKQSAPTSPSIPLLSFDNTLITLVVGQGDKSQELVAHRQQLRNSTFLNNALKKDWLEGRTRKIYLPDDQPEAVQQYLHFLYTRHLLEELWNIELAELYVFGEKMIDAHLKNAVLEEMFRPVDWIFNGGDAYEVSSTIYKGTPSGSLGRKFLVDTFHAAGIPEWVQDYDLHTEFVQDVLVKFMESERRPDVEDLSIQDYFEVTD